MTTTVAVTEADRLHADLADVVAAKDACVAENGRLLDEVRRLETLLSQMPQRTPEAAASEELLAARSDAHRLKVALARADERIAQLEGRAVDTAAGELGTWDGVVRSLGLAPHPTVCATCGGEQRVIKHSLMMGVPMLVPCADCTCPGCHKPMVGGGLCDECEIADGIDADVAYVRSQL